MPRPAPYALRWIALAAGAMPAFAFAESPPAVDLPVASTAAVALADSSTPVAADLPTEATDDNAMTLAISLLGRVTGQYNSAFRVDPTGMASTSGIEYSSRIRVRADATTKDGDHRWSVTGAISVDAIDGTLVGGASDAKKAFADGSLKALLTAK